MKSPIESLPTDLLHRLFSVLDTDSIAAARLVCRHWAAIGAATACAAFPLVTADCQLAARFPNLKQLHVRLDWHAQGQTGNDTIDALVAFLAKVMRRRPLHYYRTIHSENAMMSSRAYMCCSVASCTCMW